MKIALIIGLLCVVIGVMAYVLRVLVKLLVLKDNKHRSEVLSLKERYRNDMAGLRERLTKDFLFKAKVLEKTKEAKLAIPLKKVDMVVIPVENSRILSRYFNESPTSVSISIRQMKSEYINGDFVLPYGLLHEADSEEYINSEIAERLAKYLIDNNLIETQIDAQQRVIKFRMSVLQ